MTLQERLEKVEREIATWQERERAAHEQAVARQGQRALLLELLGERLDGRDDVPQLLRQAAK